MFRSMRTDRRGSALMISLVLVVMLAAFGAGLTMISFSSTKEHTLAERRLQALYVAESGISHAIMDLTSGGTGILGSSSAPLAFAGGSYWVWSQDNGDGTFTVTSNGLHQDGRRAVQVVLMQTGGGIYANAVYAGNSSGDPTYSMPFGGSGVQADSVTGDVYSGRNVSVTGTAAVNGTIRATGDISGAIGQEGILQPLPDIAGMNYPVNHDINVGAEFAAATYGYWAKGGNAWQLPETSPAHIFRKNPSDRAAETAGTAKDDFFLEDRFEYFGTDPSMNGASAARITLSGAGGEPGPAGNKKVYFIDGNLWLHNKYTYSFKFYTPEATGMQVTIVVRGNIYFSDNLFYLNINKDGVAFIAMNDPDVSDSGNVYFGDPRFGTLKKMEAFMYAENNFYDNNLSATGSKTVGVYGNMTAGNQVDIQRDYGAQHSKLTVNFDDRIMTGALVMPGLPGWMGTQSTYSVVSWTEVAPTE